MSSFGECRCDYITILGSHRLLVAERG